MRREPDRKKVEAHRAWLEGVRSRLARLASASQPPEDALAVLGELETIREPRLLGTLIPLARSDDARVAESTQTLLWAWVRALGPDEIREWDLQLREPERWTSLELTDLQLSTSPTIVRLLASSFASGRTREAALKWTSLVDHPEAWPFFLLRVNDWVVPLRSVAATKVLAAVDTLPPEVLTRHLPLVSALQRAKRSNHLDLVEAVWRRLRSPAGLDALRRRLPLLPRREREEAFRELVDADEPGRLDLLAWALRKPVLGLERAATDLADELLPDLELERLLPLMKQSRIAHVRRQAYVAVAQRFPDRWPEHWADALVEPYPSVREFARRRAPERDARGLYLGRMAGGRATPGVLGGLGEVGQASDVPLLLPFVSDARVAYRREALRALGRLAPEEAASYLLVALEDPSTQVVRVATRYLGHRVEQTGTSWIRRRLGPGLTVDHAQRVLSLGRDIDRWDYLGLLLSCCEQQIGSIARAAWLELDAWERESNRRFGQPTPQQRERLLEDLKRIQLDPLARRRIEFILTT